MLITKNHGDSPRAFKFFDSRYKNSIQYLLENSKVENITGADQCVEENVERKLMETYIYVCIHTLRAACSAVFTEPL